MIDGFRAAYRRADLAEWLRGQAGRLTAEAADELQRADAIELTDIAS
jgi:hypothetical protein